MAHQYRLIECPTSNELSYIVTERLADGWDLWGNPLVEVVGYDTHVTYIHYFQAMVRFDPSGHTIAGKVENALCAAPTRQEPAGREVPAPSGYSVNVPETPSTNDFHDLGAAIGSSWQKQGEGSRP